VLNGTANGAAFTLNRLTGTNGLGGPRQSTTLGLRPEGKSWSTGFQSWFNTATAAADLSRWAQRDNTVQLKYGNFLYRGVVSTGNIGTCLLHIEARMSYSPTASGQNRANSGIYLRGMHEMQVLDSFGLAGADNDLGSIYKIKAPTVNAALPPLTWQTYDCYYTAGTGTSGTFTLYVNGVQVQNNTAVNVVTEAGFAGSTLYLQNHGNEVIFNNIWLIPNATPTSLPYSTLTPPTSLRPFLISPFKARVDGLNAKGFFDLLGRQALPEKTRLTILPAF